jgi:SAM-dependent methyltransferase
MAPTIDFGRTNNLHFENIDNNYHGVKKYKFILQRNLQPIKGNRFLDLGCNTGVITACIAEDLADESIGIDKEKQIGQAWAVQDILWKDYGNLVFGITNLTNIDETNNLFCMVKHVDCILMSNVVYYLGGNTDQFLDMCANICDRIVLQGNKLKKYQGDYSDRIPEIPNYRGEYSQINGMVELLERHGFTTNVDAPDNYLKPVVTGIKR